MSKLVWDATGEHLYETGVDRVVLFPFASNGGYAKGAAWNGVTAINETPSGGEATALYADNIKYLNLMSVEELGATIEAYTYPDEFAECDGSASIAGGISIGQQTRKHFGICYRTLIGNDEEGTDHGYKIHIIYDCLASPSERSHSTVNDSPEATTLSWTVSTVPINVTGFKPSANIEIDSTKTDANVLTAIESALYGSDDEDAKMLLPDDIIKIVNGGAEGATGATGETN